MFLRVFHIDQAAVIARVGELQALLEVRYRFDLKAFAIEALRRRLEPGESVRLRAGTVVVTREAASAAGGDDTVVTREAAPAASDGSGDTGCRSC
eukprot:m.29867 g.29867  ORF g.29867 m.29867 type:complete len:95 (-) comp10489_c0_seq1:404-688(-)